MPTSRREFRTQNRNCQHGRSMSAPTAGDEGLCKKTEAATFVAASVFAGKLGVPLYVGGGALPKRRGIDVSERHRAQALPVNTGQSKRCRAKQACRASRRRGTGTKQVF